MKIRDAVAADFVQILALNEASVRFLSALNLDRLSALHRASAYHRVIEANGEVCAFLLALREGAAYDSANYVWFSAHYPRFLYIDRVVVSTSVRGQGLGRALYTDLFAFAARTDIQPVTCEFDVDPPNLPSRRFHQAFGFREVGTQRVGTANKQVSLQAVWPDTGTTTTHSRPALEYRAAHPDDVPACVDLRGRTRENAVSVERLRAVGITVESWSSDVREGRLPGHVCVADGEIVGYCFGEKASGEIVVLALLPAFENLGIGRTLLRRSMDELIGLGFTRLFLGCASDPSVRSYGFYRHLGWRTTGVCDSRGDEILEYRVDAPP